MAKRRKKSKAKGIATAVVVLIAVIAGLFFGKDAIFGGNTSDPVSGGEVQFHFIDVGQGDAALIRTEKGDILIDAGTNSSEDELNKKLISNAIAIYKDNRATLAGAVPVYPTGLSRMSDGGHTTLGLLNKEANKLLLAVWQTRTEATETVIDLTPYLTINATITRTYPDLAGFGCALNDGNLTVTFPEGNCAAYVEITL
jgi:hypothetical protein